jgi:type I restriction enzyme S subunit
MRAVLVADIAIQVRGVTYAKGEASNEPAPDRVMLLRAGNIGDRELLFDDLTYVPRGRVSPRQMLLPNDVLVATSSGSLSVVGKAARVRQEIDASFGAFCKVLRPGPDVDPSYFAHYFRTPAYRRHISSQAAGANINNLRSDDLDSLEIPLPHLSQQSRIATILDEADALCATAQEARALVARAKDAIFHEAVAGAELSSLGSVSKMYGGTSLPVGEPFSGQDGGYLCLKVSDMNRPENALGISSASAWSSVPGPRAATAPAGSVIIPKRGGAIGTNKKLLLLRPAILDPNLMAIAADGESVLPDTLLAWFKTLDLRTIQSGSSVPQLNKQDLVPLPVPLPPKESQERFMQLARDLDLIATNYRQQAASFDALFASLQHRAFRGEL